MMTAGDFLRPSTLRRGLSLTAQTLRLMIGVGDYEAYLEHMKLHHPEMPTLDYTAWYRNRVDARYGSGSGGKVSRCPC